MTRSQPYDRLTKDRANTRHRANAISPVVSLKYIGEESRGSKQRSARLLRAAMLGGFMDLNGLHLE